MNISNMKPNIFIIHCSSWFPSDISAYISKSSREFWAVRLWYTICISNRSKESLAFSMYPDVGKWTSFIWSLMMADFVGLPLGSAMDVFPLCWGQPLKLLLSLNLISDTSDSVWCMNLHSLAFHAMLKWHFWNVLHWWVRPTPQSASRVCLR